MKTYILILFFAFNFSFAAEPKENTKSKKEQVLDFSGGVIEGNLNRPSMLLELGSNYKEFNDLILLREDFNSYHELDSANRFRYVDENL
jgi:hypothetical protein